MIKEMRSFKKMKEDFERKIKNLDQVKLLKIFQEMEEEKQEKVINSFFYFDFPELVKQRESFRQNVLGGDRAKRLNFRPLQKQDAMHQDTMHLDAMHPEACEEDGNLVLEDNIAVVVLAGGMASRLNAKGPKGCYKVTAVMKKSLFQLIAEKVYFAKKKYKKKIFLSFMTSENNYEETVSFFKKNNYFGLDATQVDFFKQRNLPFLDETGEYVLDDEMQIVSGPNGNGDIFSSLAHSGLLKNLQSNGVKYLTIMPVDNPLFDPVDVPLINQLKKGDYDIAAIAIEKDKYLSHMGVFALDENGSLNVIEYTEKADKNNIKEKCSLLYTGLFCADLKFLINLNFDHISDHKVDLDHKVGLDQVDLDYHFTLKDVNYNFNGVHIKKKLYKSEKFIFDIFPISKKVKTVIYPKEKCFSPLKNEKGDNSLLSVQKALCEKDRSVFKEIFDNDFQGKELELSPEFYYLTSEQKKYLKNKGPCKGSYLRI